MNSSCPLTLRNSSSAQRLSASSKSGLPRNKNDRRSANGLLPSDCRYLNQQATDLMVNGPGIDDWLRVAVAA